MRPVALFVSTVLLGCLPSTVLASSEGPTAAECWKAAMTSQDPAAAADCYAPDAVLWLPGTPMLSGRDAIREGYAGFFAAYDIRSASVTDLGSHADGDTVTHWGYYELVMVPKEGGDEITDRGRYTDVSRRIDGKWLYIVDHASSEPAAK